MENGVQPLLVISWAITDEAFVPYVGNRLSCGQLRATSWNNGRGAKEPVNKFAKCKISSAVDVKLFSLKHERNGD